MAFSNGWRGPDIVGDGLITYLDAGSPNSYQPFFGTTGSVWKDMSGSGSGTPVILSGSATYSTSNGGYLTFSGNQSCFFSSFAWPTTFSINFWLYYQGGGGSFPRIIGTNNFRFEISSLNTGVIAYYGTAGWITTTATISINGWSNLCVTRAADSTFTVYINGVNQHIGTLNLADPGIHFYIARQYTPNTEGSSMRLSTFMIYNRALSPEEVKSNYDAQKSRFGLT